MGDAAKQLIARWRAGSQEAAQELFRMFAGRLTALARSRLSPKLARRLDPEDVVQSAYRSFFAATRDQAFDLEHGGDLWQFLVAITLHKLKHQVQRHTAKKRDVGAERGLSSEGALLGISAERLAQGPSPLEAAALVDELEDIMRNLEPLPRRILELRLQGYGDYEIAHQIGRSVPTGRRVLGRFKVQFARWHAECSHP